MAELQKLIQNSNGAFESDLLKSFVAKHRSDIKPELSPQKGTTHGGASIFSPTTTTTGNDTTDNAKIIKENLPDNHKAITTTTTTNKTLNENVDNRSSTTATTTTTPTTNLNAAPNNANLNAAPKNANLNAKNLNNKNAPGARPDHPDPNANESEVSSILQEVRGGGGGAMSDSRHRLVQQVSQAAVDAHLSTCINTHQAVAEARGRFMAMKAAGQLPDMSKLSLSSGAMWEKMMDQMMPELAKTMKFFKMLPGFIELGQADQMMLIKAGTFEVMMTRFAMLIDHERDTMLDPSHKMVCPRHVVQEMPMGEFLDGFFHVGRQFNPLGLTDGEVGLFTAVLAFSPCRPGLADGRLVASLQTLYHQAFYSMLKESHSDPDTTFRQALSLVPMFRRMSEEHSKALGAMKTQAPDAFTRQFPPVHKELYSDSQ